MPNRDTLFLNRYVTGLRSRSVVHLGTYFGNLRHALEAQESCPQESFVLIADQHVLAGPGGVSNVQQENYTLLRKLLALGFDPERTIIYRQSDVPELFECMWLLSCCAQMGDLRETADYDRVHETTIASSLYPLLMAADILGLRASHVTVGQDEADHVVYAANVAGVLKDRGVRLPMPVRNPDVRTTVLGTDGKRMSWSGNNAIRVFDAESTVRRQIMNIPSSAGSRRDAVDPETDIAFKLYSVMAPREKSEVLASEYKANRSDDRETKLELLKEFFRHFEDARIRFEGTAVSDDECEAIFATGRKRVRTEFRATIAEIRDTASMSVQRRQLETA